ncbi:gliding motility lipoprotein GldJ [Lewinellaceae bacterium SD302]|nr:gliding motility lipoprotein GldJ [Lewinellaceae bacterium SD302]
MKNIFRTLTLLCVVALLLPGCGKKERSSTTGWKYNDQEWGGFEKNTDYEGQETPPNMVLIPGGTFVMGYTEEDVTYDWDNVSRRVTVSSFYMDETEMANIDYREYLYWLQRTYGASYPEVYQDALPDTLVWRDELAFNEPMVETYFRHPSYDEFPVVGVSWKQAGEYARWRGDRVNEGILIDKGILNPNPEQKDNDVFNTKAYLAGQYQGDVRKGLKDLRTGEERGVRFEDGILLPEFRLPTEAEWEYAALALQGLQENEKDENYTDRRIYPWNGTSVRYQVHDRDQGKILANFKRGRGDYMGIAGRPNDEAPFPDHIRENYPNDFGLYNMAGNVNEWVLDVYRPLTALTLEDVDNHDLNPFRGNEFKEMVRDENGRPVEKDSLGRLRFEYVDDADAAQRDNYKVGRPLDYLDGDQTSQAYYASDKYTLISDKARVYKGGGWADRAYYLSPGTRRYMDEDRSSRNVGFRCAMVRTGASQGNDAADENRFKTARKRRRSRR